METTKLYVEYIVVGMETLAIIFLVIFIIIGNAFLPIIKYCIKNIVPSIIMLGWCYILGLIVDRIADIIYDKRKMHIKEKYPIVAETSIIVWEHFKQDGESQLVVRLVVDLVVAEGYVAHRQIVEVTPVCGLKTGNSNVSLRIQHLGNAPGDAVQFHAVQPAVCHAVRQHSKEVAHTKTRLQNVTAAETHAFHRIVDTTDNGGAGVVGVQGTGTSGGV